MKNIFDKQNIISTFLTIGNIACFLIMIITLSGSKINSEVSRKTITLYNENGEVLETYTGEYKINYINENVAKVYDAKTGKFIYLTFANGNLIIKED